MPGFHHHADVVPSTLAHPRCKHCKSPMMLVSIDPATPGVDLHTFECGTCEHEFSTYQPYDSPKRSKGRVQQGWMNSS